MGLLSFGGKWVLKLVVSAALVAGILFYLGQGLQNASLEDFDIEGIKDLNTDSFTIFGNLFVKNPSDLSIPIESIKYDVILVETNEKIGSGYLPSFTLEKKKSNMIPFNQQVNWIPTVKLASELITEDEVLVEINGEIIINLPKVKEHSIPFSQETDIKEYIQQFVTSPIDEQLPIGETPTLPINDQPDDSTPKNPVVPENPIDIVN